MAKPKKPTLLKLPKKPKSKTINSMESYLKRKKEVEKKNKSTIAKYNSDVKKWEKLKNQL